MQYFKTELSLPATLRALPRDPGYRRTLRYGHARLRARAADVRDLHAGDTHTVRLIPLPRVQAVVDAVLGTSIATSLDASADANTAARVA